MWAVQGILAALYERQHTGKGRLVECLLLETAIGFSSCTSAQWLADHEEPTRQGSRHRQNAPYQCMQTKDGYLMVGPPARRSGRAVPRLGAPGNGRVTEYSSWLARMLPYIFAERAIDSGLVTLALVRLRFEPFDH